MYQQMDCAIDKEHVSRKNLTGCLHDLQSAIMTTYSTPPGGTPHDTGQTMAFFNMQQGDAPITKRLADKYTLSDNYHQPVMGRQMRSGSLLPGGEYRSSFHARRRSDRHARQYQSDQQYHSACLHPQALATC
jgi:hypothetical protein